VAAVMQRYHKLQQEFVDQQLALAPVVIPNNQVGPCGRLQAWISYIKRYPVASVEKLVTFDLIVEQQLALEPVVVIPDNQGGAMCSLRAWCRVCRL
jgi:hypothetical protein